MRLCGGRRHMRLCGFKSAVSSGAVPRESATHHATEEEAGSLAGASGVGPYNFPSGEDKPQDVPYTLLPEMSSFTSSATANVATRNAFRPHPDLRHLPPRGGPLPQSREEPQREGGEAPW